MPLSFQAIVEKLPRRWTDEDVAALDDGSRRAVAELEAGGGS